MVVVEVDEVVEDVVVVGEVVVVLDVVVVVVESCQADAGSGKKLNRIAGSGISQWLNCFISVPCSEY